MDHVWYILAHASLGVIGSDVFRLNLPGTLLCMAACSVLQAWPTWQIHKIAWPRFRATLGAGVAADERARMTRGYWLRLGRVLAFRTSVYAIVTLGIAAIARG